MADKEWLQDLFIEEAKPALDRHSGGGGGGGSSDLIDCDEFPTEGVKENAVYRKQWAEERYVEPSCTVYINNGGDITELPSEEYVTVDSLDSLDEGGIYLYTGDGNIYTCAGGVVMDYATAAGLPADTQLGFIDSVDEFSSDAPDIQIGTVLIVGGLIRTNHEDVGVSNNVEKLTISKYVDGKWRKFGLLSELLSARGAANLFAGCESLQQVDSLINYHDTSDVTTMESMFIGCLALIDVPLLDTSKVTDMGSMFEACESLTSVPLFDTGKVNIMCAMFGGCKNLTTVPLFDTRNVYDMANMFSDCYELTDVPLFDTSKVERMAHMFSNCHNLTTVPLFDTSNVIDMAFMFSNCYKLTDVPLFDTSKVTDMGSMFSGCDSLTSVPLFDTSKVVTMYSMFNGCNNLTTVPLFDTSNVTNMSSMFNYCYGLTDVPSFDIRKVTNANSMFYNCDSLVNCYLRNIKANLQVGSGTSYGHLLTVDSLVHLVKELVNTNHSRTLTIGSANLTKIASVYVKQIDITDEMRAEDDLIDSKLACEVCESTDAGAMLLKDFAYLKNWTLK